MPSPRVWSRDDFLEAVKLSANGDYRKEQWEGAQRACAVLEFAERNAVLHDGQQRDERGRFIAKPQLHLDSAIVTAARAGG